MRSFYSKLLSNFSRCQGPVGAGSKNLTTLHLHSKKFFAVVVVVLRLLFSIETLKNNRRRNNKDKARGEERET